MTYHLLRFFLKLISRLPFRVLYILADVVYFLLYYIIRYRRRIVRKNLTEAFPEKSPAEIKKIEKEFYHFFADNLLESCKMANMSPEEMSRRMNFTNINTINDVLRNGQSIAIYLGHYANWEWVSSMPIHLEKSAVAAQIYHKLRNKEMDKLILEHRSAFGAVSVEMYQTARYITGLAHRKQVSIIGFIADQSPKKREVHHFIPFMHHNTPVLTGTEKLIKHYGFDPWFLYTKRIKRGYYEAEFIHIHDNPKTLPDFQLTEMYFQMLEKVIRKQPELYLWTHNRFKHAQPLTPQRQITTA